MMVDKFGAEACWGPWAECVSLTHLDCSGSTGKVDIAEPEGDGIFHFAEHKYGL